MTRNNDTDAGARSTCGSSNFDTSTSDLSDDALRAVTGGYPVDAPNIAMLNRILGDILPDGIIPLPEPIAPVTPVAPSPGPTPPCPSPFPIYAAGAL